MKTPKNIEDLSLLITNEVQESIHLDYKASAAINKKKRHEIAKDVSAFANSDGGLLIYSIREDAHIPVEIDEGVDHRTYTREWLEEVITSNVTPIIDGLKIYQIPLSENTSAFVVEVPKSNRAPHQEQSSKRYYKRYNFKSQPMENYEINDVRNRSHNINPLVNFDISIKHKTLVYFVISNIGSLPAEDVTITFSIDLPWRDETRKPPILTKGIKYLPPEKQFKWLFRSAQEIFAKDSQIPNEFEVTVKYFHPSIGQYYTDSFQVDFYDYLYTEITESEIYQHGKKIEACFESLTKEVKDINGHLEGLSTIASPTGLDFSITTLKDMASLIAKKNTFVKIDPFCCNHHVFKEVLEIDSKLAFKVSQHFWGSSSSEGIENIEGIDKKIIDDLHKYFKI